MSGENRVFEIALSNAAQNSKWVNWIISDSKIAAHSTLEFLRSCFASIPKQKRSGVLKKLGGDENHIDATIHELVAHELLLRLGLSPEFEPAINDKTPDLRFMAGGQTYLADVFVTHSPLRTFTDFGDGTGEAWDTSKPHESRAKKIADTIAKKAQNYRALGFPLVLFVFFGDNRILGCSDVERALYGITAYEASLEDEFPKSLSRDRVPVGGLLLPDESGNCVYKHLSAVVACDWFYTLNRSDPGKRIHCFVLHNFVGQELPTSAFAIFSQIVWKQVEPDVWRPDQTISKGVVAKFTNDGGIECREYTSNMAW